MSLLLEENKWYTNSHGTFMKVTLLGKGFTRITRESEDKQSFIIDEWEFDNTQPQDVTLVSKSKRKDLEKRSKAYFESIRNPKPYSGTHECIEYTREEWNNILPHLRFKLKTS